MHQNILQLFGLISATKVIAYLEQHGWQLASDPQEGIAVFGSPGGTAAEPSQVSISTSDEHPLFRRQLPNVVFALCIFEDRPALDIANEMYALRLAAAASAETVAPGVRSWQRTVIQQHRQSLLHVWIEPSNVPFHWDQGDRLELLTRSGVEPPRIVLREDGILIQGGEPGQFRAFLGCESPLAGNRPTISSVVAHEIDRLSEFEFPNGREAFVEQLAPVLARIDFDLPTSGAEQGPLAAETVRRQVALVAATFAKMAQHAERALWRIAQRLASSAELCLDAHPMASEDLWIIAKDDSPDFPRQTLQWLEENAVDPRKIQALD